MHAVGSSLPAPGTIRWNGSCDGTLFHPVPNGGGVLDPMHTEEVNHETQYPVVVPERTGGRSMLQAAIDVAQHTCHGFDDHGSGRSERFHIESEHHAGYAFGPDQPEHDATA